MDQVSFAYGEHMVLDHISLTVKSGDRIGIIGTSGCGKSTMLKLLSGLYASQSGRVEVEGETEITKIRQKVAMVMQNAMLLPVSIKENITCGHPMKEDCIQEAMEAAKLTEWIATLPDGMDTLVGERGNMISGGQAQRIAIARAIAKHASVVLLDEATSALDATTSEAVHMAIKNLTKGKTVLCVTHHMDNLINYDHIYRLEGGHLFDS
jgi:ABC-type multidrug transport system fused ATPase/permease subunit